MTTQTNLYRVTTGTTYNPLKRIRAENREDAAGKIADRVARLWYGRKGYCHHVRYDCRRMDNSQATFEAFVGRTVSDGCEGRNIWIYVS
jgi:hypothetical protein